MTTRPPHFGWRFLAAFVVPLYLLDQVTKWATVSGYEHGLLPRDVIPGFFTLVYWQNTGAAFSIGDGQNSFFIGLAAAATLGLLVAWARGAFPDRLSATGAALLLPGIVGNLTDRIIHGHVVDFLLFDLHVPFANPWPAFNVADSLICIAVGLFILGSFQPAPKPSTPA